MHKILIIGYGNPLRGDDGVGSQAARLLDAAFHGQSGVRVMGAHQLTPELAEDVSESDFVLFLDAAVGSIPGEIRPVPVQPQPGPASLTHHLVPSALLAAAEQLYGSVPRALTLTLVGCCFELGQCLSPAIQDRLPEYVKQAQAIVTAELAAAAMPVHS